MFVPDVERSSQRGWSSWPWMPHGTQPASSESLSHCASRECASRECASRECISRECTSRECASGSVLLGSSEKSDFGSVILESVRNQGVWSWGV